MALLITYTHHTEQQVITALSLISKLNKSLHHPLSLFPACCIFISRSLATVSNSGDSSASLAQVLFHSLLLQILILNILSADNKLSGWWPFRINLLSSLHRLTFNRLGQSQSQLLYDWRFTANQFVLPTSPLRLTNRIFISQLKTCGYSPHVTSSLTRVWVCRLQLLHGPRQRSHSQVPIPRDS
jgi:hypothetical protein